MPRMTSIRALLPAALLLGGGCATTGTPRSAPAAQAAKGDDQRVAAVEDRVREMAQRLDGVDSRVKNLEGTVPQVADRADSAAKRVAEVDQRLTRLWTNRFNQKTSDTIEVYFPLDSSQLPDTARTVLLDIIKEMRAHPSMTVELGGYTDPGGGLEYNQELSQRRVDAVRRFMSERGIQLSRIQAVSLGPIRGGGIPAAQKRRVTIKLMVDQE
jgi:outer membrane protein OmpA-like peptidoglycan-associated protein